MQTHGMAKNLSAITDLLGSFAVQSVIDPFAGRGTVGLAAAALDMACMLIERDAAHIASAVNALRFIGEKPEVINCDSMS